MGKYAAQEDVLRVLGGTDDGVQRHFDIQLWDGGPPVTSVTVDVNTFDVPDTILARINAGIVKAESKIDGYILAHYQTTPTVVPANLTQTTAEMAAYHSTVGIDSQTDYLRNLHKEAMQWMRDIAAGKVDLGIPDPRPAHIAPHASVVGGLGRWRGCY